MSESLYKLLNGCKMRSLKLNRLLLLISIMIIGVNEISAQFEQKFTMQFSAGTSFIISNYPVQPRSSIHENVYDNGVLLNGGLQYNFSRKFSMIGLVMWSISNNQ